MDLLHVLVAYKVSNYESMSPTPCGMSLDGSGNYLFYRRWQMRHLYILACVRRSRIITSRIFEISYRHLGVVQDTDVARRDPLSAQGCAHGSERKWALRKCRKRVVAISLKLSPRRLSPTEEAEVPELTFQPQLFAFPNHL